MADKLTPQQHQAVYDRGGMLLVSAAAGSGKTKVLVDRILTYLTDPTDPANLDEFLIITYTKAAAAELRGKIASKLTERIAMEPENRHLQKQMQRLFLTKISTVHGFCGDLLREYTYRLDLPADFRVADENECRELRETVLKDLLEKAYAQEDQLDFYAFVDSQGLGRDDRLIPQIVEKVYDSARCHLDPQNWLDSCLAAADMTGVEDASQTQWGRYLMEDLYRYLDCQIKVMDRCVEEMERSEGLEKPIINYRDTLDQMRRLRDSATWDEIVSRRNISYGRLTFPKKNVDSELIERVKAARNACKEGLEKKLQRFVDDSHQVLADLSQSAAGVRGLIALVRQFEQDYQSMKRSRRVLDFSDLEHKTLDLLWGRSRNNPTAAAAEIGRRYREILVDEYQDSNGVQDAIFTALSREKQNCFLVGDVKQSIYQFRLADPGIFLEKYHSYVPAADAQKKQGRKVLLSHNFRSGPEVIEAVNDVFRTCMRPETGGLYYGEEEALRKGEAVAHPVLPDPAVELHAIEVDKETYPEEAAFVAERIEDMLKSKTLVRDGDGFRPVVPEDIVILLRSPNSAGRYFQQALEARGIRCSTGGSTDLLQTEEIGILRSLLQTVVNPRLDIPLLSVLASPVFGFTADDLAVIRSGRKHMTLYDALVKSGHPKADEFLTILQKLRRESRMRTLTDLMEECFYLTRMDSIYGSMAGGEVRRNNLQTFYKIAADFEKGALRDLNQFLDHLTAMEESGLVVNGAGTSGCVTIMSIHKSKGLEFPVVFLSNLSRVFNQESTRAQVLCDKELGVGLSVADTVNRVRYPSIAKHAIAVKMRAESVSEEVRVLYVAMTRARDRLIMTYAMKNLEKNLQQKSLRYDFDGGKLLCCSAVCLGDWVMLEALQHTEAGQLHGLAGRPLHTRIGEYPWYIALAQAPEVLEGSAVQAVRTQTVTSDDFRKLQESLSFRYRYLAATQAPSKQTATGRKGRQKDEEAAENAPKKMERSWRKPDFLNRQIQGKAFGNVIHRALQYIRYENCGSEEEIRQEIHRLVEQRYLSLEEGEMVSIRKVADFFDSEIGKKLRNGVPHLREFKFSILDDGRNYGEGLEGESVLLQGVVDCALLDEDGITIVDFKTDAVTEETVEATTQRYRSQIMTYGDALCRIYEMPIKAMYLYYFRLNKFVKV